MMTAAHLPLDLRQRLDDVSDDWAMQPAEWSPSALVRSLKGSGYVRLKRERPAAMSPYRYYLRRTPAGRAALGLAAIEDGQS